MWGIQTHTAEKCPHARQQTSTGKVFMNSLSRWISVSLLCRWTFNPLLDEEPCLVISRGILIHIMIPVTLTVFLLLLLEGCFFTLCMGTSLTLIILTKQFISYSLKILSSSIQIWNCFTECPIKSKYHAWGEIVIKEVQHACKNNWSWPVFPSGSLC